MPTKEIKKLPTDNEMFEKWVECGSAKRAAPLLETTEHQVRMALARKGEEAQMLAIKTKLFDLFMCTATAARESISSLEPWRKMNAARDLFEVLRKMTGGDVKGSTQNIGNIFIGAERAESLKRTMETVEGEVIDDSSS